VSPFFLSDVPKPKPYAELGSYLSLPEIARLGWPDDVVRQWLFELGDNPHFLEDYGSIDLLGIRWTLDELTTDELGLLGTGASENGVLEENARLHAYWVSVRSADVLESWEARGTWLVAPLLIARNLVSPHSSGLQILEGRTRVGVLRGRRRDGLEVAERHQVWVGRAVAATGSKPDALPEPNFRVQTAGGS
jgi:hypothetical protein